MCLQCGPIKQAILMHHIDVSRNIQPLREYTLRDEARFISVHGIVLLVIEMVEESLFCSVIGSNLMNSAFLQQSQITTKGSVNSVPENHDEERQFPTNALNAA